MNNYDLILFNNGEIEIVKHNLNGLEIVYHKDFNLGDHLQINLVKAFSEWNRLTGGYEENEDAII